MGRRRGPVRSPVLLILPVVLAVYFPSVLSAQGVRSQTAAAKPEAAQPITITAARIEYLKENDVYEAAGSVEIVQGTLRLTADRVTILMLSGTLVATGHVHLKDPTSDLWSEQLTLDINTSAGVVANGTVYIKDSNTLVTGRLFQRFSDDHFRVKDGTFTNCDAEEKQIPAWRFRFKDLDMNVGESLYANNLWFCVNDVPLVPLPSIRYPISTARKSGFLVPTVGYNTVFGTTYQGGYFWAINPSQDLMIAPLYMSKRGYGTDLDYRYILSRQTKGQWMTSILQDTVLDRTRGLLSGTHTQQVNKDLSIRGQVFALSDRTYLQNLSNSGIQRGMASGNSNLFITQRVPYGDLYLLGQYLQPLTAGSPQSFQRFPEIGQRFANVSLFNGPVLAGMESNLVTFYRNQGFSFNRGSIMPSLSTDVLNIGHVVGITPQVRMLEVYYTRGVSTEHSVNRETFWAGLEAASRLTRRVSLEQGKSLLHTIEPSVIYEYVPPTGHSQIIQVDNTDYLPKKNLMTYMLRSRLLEQAAQRTGNWMDITVAQSYHLGGTQQQALQFPFVGTPQYSLFAQPLQFPTVPIQGRKFSDIWTRVVLGKPIVPLQTAGQFGTSQQTTDYSPNPYEKALTLTVDSFFDPYREKFSQFNTDVRYQHDSLWYVQVGQRYTNDGLRVWRGDIWNPISFNQVFAPTAGIEFVTAAGAFRTPFGWTIGANTYYNIETGTASQTDVVGLYQNPCRCWSLALFYIQFPDRVQYNFLLSLTGIGWTQNFGTAIVQTILSPLMIGERGVPWAAPQTKRQPTPEPPPAGATPKPSTGGS